MHGEPAPWDFFFASVFSYSLRCVLLLPLKRPDLGRHLGELSTLFGMVLEPALRDFCTSESIHVHCAICLAIRGTNGPPPWLVGAGFG